MRREASRFASCLQNVQRWRLKPDALAKESLPRYFLVPMLLRGNALSSRLRLGIRRQEPTIHWVPTQEHGNQLLR